MSSDKVSLEKSFDKTMKNFAAKYGGNIAVCEYKLEGKNEFVVFQFCVHRGDVVAVQCEPLFGVKGISKILYKSGLAVENTERLIKIRGA